MTTTSRTPGQDHDGAPLDLELAVQLKSVVDALRELLWAYIEALSAKSGSRPQEVIEWYNVELALGMLESRGSRTIPTVEAPEAASSGTFQDLVATALTVTALHTGLERRL